VAAWTSKLPFSGDDPIAELYGVEFELRDRERLDRIEAYRYAVTPTYFDALGIPVRRGRVFTAIETTGGARPVVINESFAARVFGAVDPIGQRLRFAGDANRPWDVVVGVVGDVKQTSLAAANANAVYVDADRWLWADRSMWLVVRAPRDAAALTPIIKRAVWAVDKDQPVVRASTMEAMIVASQAKRRFALIVFELFAVAALALAAIGIYGVLACSVVERTREIGVRSALGASRRDVIALVLSEAVTLTGAGAAIGLVGAALASRGLASLLFGVSRMDPAAYAAATVVLGAVAAIACWGPAYRASRIDPAITLRAE
jgi:putative ABC transport system permease protein